MSGPVGVRLDRLESWLAANVPGLGGDDLTATLIPGGRSNLTYVLEASDRRLVLRRPPLGNILPTAHDMAREYRVLSALHGSAVPVPEPFAYCADAGVIGAPFYLMEHVPGTALAALDDAARLTPDQAVGISSHLVAVLSALHEIDYEAADLGGFGRPEGFVERQIRRWYEQWGRSRTRDLADVDTLVERLAARCPATASRPAIVHGDYRLDNTLVTLRPEPRITAVVDWEMATIGEPLTDLAMLLVYWSDAGDDERLLVPVAAGVTAFPGFFTRAQIVETYARLTGRDLADLDFFVALASFKLAVVLEGIHARHLAGNTVGGGFDRYGAAVPVLVAAGLRRLAASGR